MDTPTRMFFALLGAVIAGFAFIRLWGAWKRWSVPSTPGDLAGILDQVAPGIPGTSIVDGGLKLFHRGLRGRLDFISDKTEIQVGTGTLIGQVVEVVPVGFPMSLVSGGGKERMRARGSRSEYDRIFKNRAEEQVLLEVGVPYDLRMSPDGVTFRLHSLPESAAVLGYWIACAFRIVDLIPGVIEAPRVQVTEVATRVGGDTLCQVCGASLAEETVVRCARCSTPHHEQCWDYAGKCSTFGCTGQKAVR